MMFGGRSMTSTAVGVFVTFGAFMTSNNNNVVNGAKSDDPDFTDMTDLVNGLDGSTVAKLYYRLELLDESVLPSTASTTDEEANAITFKMIYDGGLAWLGLGLSPDSQMIGTESAIGVIDTTDGSSSVLKYGPITAKNGNGVTSTLVSSDGQTLINATMTQTSSESILMFTEVLSETGETASYDINGANPMSFAIGGDNSFPSYHSGGRAAFTLDLSTATRPSATTTMDNMTKTNVTTEESDPMLGDPNSAVSYNYHVGGERSIYVIVLGSFVSFAVGGVFA